MSVTLHHRDLEAVVVGVGYVSVGIADVVLRERLQQGGDGLVRIEGGVAVLRGNSCRSYLRDGGRCRLIAEQSAKRQILRIKLIDPESATVTTVGDQEVPLGADVAHGQCDGICQGSLETEAPANVLWRSPAVIGVAIGSGLRSGGRCGKIRTETYAVACHEGGRRRKGWETGVELLRRKEVDCIVINRLRTCGETQRAGAVSRDGRTANTVAVGVHHAPATAPYSLRIALEGESKTRSEVLEVVAYVCGAVAGTAGCGVSGESDRSLIAGDRIGCIRIQEGEPIELFPIGWVKVITRDQGSE